MYKIVRLLISIIITTRIFSASAGLPASITSFADIVEPLIPSVVNIYTVRYNASYNATSISLPEMLPLDKFDSYFEQFNVPFSFEGTYKNNNILALGSGFIVGSEGYIITNDHVVAGSDEIYIKFHNNIEVPAVIIGTDPKTDIALLKVNVKQKLQEVKFANSSEVRVGDIVIAIGNPLGFGGTVTTGIISSKGRDLGINQDELVDDFLQTDAAINTGNSGGPLYDINGKVIGMNTSVPDLNGGTNIGIGFAIPSNTVTSIMHQLKKQGKIRRGRLDVGIQEVSEELAEALSLNDTNGVLVVNVKPGGIGEQAGLKRGDLITHFNKQIIINPRKLQLYIADSNIGDEVLLTIIRDGKTIDLTAKIIEYQQIEENSEANKINTISHLGVIFGDISPELRRKFAISDQDQGIIILNITPDAVDLGLAVGDLVTSINQKPIKNIQEFDEIYKELHNNTKKNHTILLIKRGEFTMFTAFPIK